MSKESEKQKRQNELVEGVNPAEHVDLFPAEVQPSSHDGIATAVSAALRHALPATLAESIVEIDDMGIKVDHARFRQNRPQADFVRLPWPLATRDPDDTELAIWWYAAGIHDGKLYLEGMRGPNVKALACSLAYRPPAARASDLVEALPENEPQAGVPKGTKRARGAGALKSEGPMLPTVAVPDDCEIVFRHLVEGEVIGKWGPKDIAMFVFLEAWEMYSHPAYVKLKQQASGWEETKAEGLYPSGGGLYG